MTDDLKLDLLKVFYKHNIITETFLIHEQIRMDYRKLKRKMSSRKAKEKLADDYHTSFKNVEKILYGKYKKLYSPG